MFESENRLFGLAPGVDFPRAFVSGLEQRLGDAEPEDWARVTLIVNTNRMARRLREIFAEGPPRLLPRIMLITDLTPLLPHAPKWNVRSGLRRRLDLMALVRGLIEREDHFAAHGGLFDLTDSLAALMDEMEAEGVPPEAITKLDVADESGHWARTQAFIAIARTYLDQLGTAKDTSAHAKAVVDGLLDHWQAKPASGPVILAGSTGSRGAVQRLMQAVLALPQGAVVLPGYDFEMPDHAWAAMQTEDHPQYRFRALAMALGHDTPHVKVWTDTLAPAPLRNSVVSLSLRPAPTTDAWLAEAPSLGDLKGALDNVTLIQAESDREEAQAIALRLRHAAQQGQSAALISPDRMLTRQVTAALGQWGIVPDDSAGTPLHLTPPGRFLRHIAGLFSRRLDAEALLTLLKHPLTASGGERAAHQKNTQALELKIRRKGLPYPDVEGLMALSEDAVWAAWVGQTLCGLAKSGKHSLPDWVSWHIHIAETLAAGPSGVGSGTLWLQLSGIAARNVMQHLEAEASEESLLEARDYVDLIGGLLAAQEVRDRDAPFAGIMIWGTIEARVQGADLVILGGLNDGTWPAQPAPDPWLNRSMRRAAGLLLPERRIGLAAHDYQQAIAAPEVWLTRAIRSDGTETVPSRWLNRLQNLLSGLPEQNGKAALDAAKARGASWCAAAAAREQITQRDAARRPSPRPPVAARPRDLRVTDIKLFKRDPYAIYARHCLRLRPLGPLVQTPDALLRGTVLHDVMEMFIRKIMAEPDALTPETLSAIGADLLLDQVPWPAARHLWQARLDRIADWFTAREAHRQTQVARAVFENEATGTLALPPLGITLRGRADRIDIHADGSATIFDYKTGQPPSPDKQRHFDRQLLIEAAMLEQGCFGDLGPMALRDAVYIGLGGSGSEIGAPLADEPPAKVLEDLRILLGKYLAPETGYTARRAQQYEKDSGDYDHLARYGEWDMSDDPVAEDLT